MSVLNIFQRSSSTMGSDKENLHLLPAASGCVLLQHVLHSKVKVLLRQRQRDAGHGLDLSPHILG